MKLIQLINAQAALNALANADGLDTPVAFRVGKCVNAITDEMKAYEDVRIKTLRKLGTLNPETNQFTFADNGAEFNECMQKVQEEEVDLKLSTFTLGELTPAGLKPIHLAALDAIGIISAPETEDTHL